MCSLGPCLDHLPIAGEMKQLRTCLSLPEHAAVIVALGNLKGITGQKKVY